MDGRKWILFVTDATEQERVVPLTTGRALTIGRAEASGLKLKTPSVSRDHALLEWHLERPFLSDRGSTHGTRIGTEIITTARELRSGDSIHLANATLRIVALDPSDPHTATLPAVHGQEPRSPAGRHQSEEAQPNDAGGHGSSAVKPWHQRSKAAVLGAGALAAAVLGVVNLWIAVFPPDPADVAEIESLQVVREMTLADFASEGTAGKLSIRPAALGKVDGGHPGTESLLRARVGSPLPTLQVPTPTASAPSAPPPATTSVAPSTGTITPTHSPTYMTPFLGPTSPPGLAPATPPSVSSSKSSTLPPVSGSLPKSFIFRADITVPEAITDAVCEQDELGNLEKDACFAALGFRLETVDEQGAFVPPAEAASALAEALSEVEVVESDQGKDPAGWTLAVRLDLEGLANRPMLLSWSLDGRDIPEAWRNENLAYTVTATTPHDAGVAQVWIPNLERAGPYNVNIRLSFASEGTIADIKQLPIANE